MVLIKCKCGCFYTLNAAGFQKDKNLDRMCPNCKATHRLSGYTSIRSVNDVLNSDIIEIQRIPDDANIEVSYRLC